ncbi:MFS transporter [Micromonospora chersina]|uniref:MFS transporter n=1 Tax=Micromonospora chersina TaxID=47854 RepID=UPI003717D1C6
MTSVTEQGTPSAPTEETPEPYRHRWVALAAILGAEVMDLLDGTIMNVAAPTIREDLGGGFTVIQWMTAGYTLPFAVLLIVGGRLGDMFGRKRMFLVGAAGFTLASLLCAVVQDPWQMIAARALQGGLGALMIPQGLGLIKAMFPRKEQAAAFGAFGPVMGLSAVGGPILAGFLIDTDLFDTGWRMVFLINLPIGLATVFAALRYLPEARVDSRPRLDLGGIALVTTGVLLLVLPLVQGHELDWPAWTFVMMAVAVVILALFAWYEVRRERRGEAAVIELSLMRKPRFLAGLLVALVFFSGTAGMSLMLGVYLQAGLGWSPTRTAATMMPWALFLVVGAILTGAVLGAKLGRKALHLGLLVMIAGVLLMRYTVGRHHGGLSSWDMVPSVAVSGLGMGIMIGLLFDISLADVEPEESGTGGGVLTAVQQLGFGIGVALVGTVFFGFVGANAAATVTGRESVVRTQLAEVGVPAGAQDQILADLKRCLTDTENQKDAAVTPESCQRGEPADAAVAQVVRAAGADAHRRTFTDGIERSFLLVIGLLGLSFVLAFLLPPRAREESEGH